MKYDFTSIMDRHGKDAIAVDGLGTGFAPAAPKEGFDAIPMWVADMNFPTVPTIQEAIIERTNHPAFGYFNPTDEYFDSIIRWQAKRNGVQGLTKECIGYENGVLGGVISALNCVCSRGDKILIHSPTYMGFTLSLKNNGYEAVHSPLVKDENGVWRMDFEDMEKHLKEEKIHAAIMCNPHNPCGPQNGKHLSQLDKVQGLNGGLNLLLTVVLKIEQGLMQRVIGGPFAGLRFLLLQHIPRKLQLEFAIICVAEFVAQPGDRGFGRVAGLCKLRRGGDRGPLYICKNAVRNAPFGAVKLEPGAQLGDDASRGIVHSNTSLCALCIGHNAQYSGNSIPIFW